MKKQLLILVRLRIEVGTTRKAKSKISHYLVFGRIVNVLLNLIVAIGKLYKMTGLNR